MRVGAAASASVSAALSINRSYVLPHDQPIASSCINFSSGVKGNKFKAPLLAELNFSLRAGISARVFLISFINPPGLIAEVYTNLNLKTARVDARRPPELTPELRRRVVARDRSG